MGKHYCNIELRGLSTGYRSKSAGLRTISNKLNLSVLNGELIMLMGPNGCGKSTLMHTVAGLLDPLAGEIHVAGKEISKIGVKERAKQLSLVLTDKIDNNNLSVWDIVVIGRYPYVSYRGRLNKSDKETVFNAMEVCMLKGFESRLFSELSDGEKQRVMIARALAQETPVMMLDEPTAHLDLSSRLEVMIMLKKLASLTGKSILLSTHEMDLALQWADTIWLMNKDGDIHEGAPEDLVLNGCFESVFGNDKLDYDADLGEFTVKQSKMQAVRIVGEGRRYRWTQSALKRNGYSADDRASSKLCVEVRGEDWILSCEDQTIACKSIKSLLQTIHIHKNN